MSFTSRARNSSTSSSRSRAPIARSWAHRVMIAATTSGERSECTRFHESIKKAVMSLRLHPMVAAVILYPMQRGPRRDGKVYTARTIHLGQRQKRKRLNGYMLHGNFLRERTDKQETILLVRALSCLILAHK